MKFETASAIDVYPVGLLRDWQHFTRNPDRKKAWPRFRHGLRYPFHQAKAHEWRAIKNYFNGYLAEPAEFAPGLTRCGSGWTRVRAYRDLQRRMRAAPGRPQKPGGIPAATDRAVRPPEAPHGAAQGHSSRDAP